VGGRVPAVSQCGFVPAQADPREELEVQRSSCECRQGASGGCCGAAYGGGPAEDEGGASAERSRFVEGAGGALATVETRASTVAGRQRSRARGRPRMLRSAPEGPRIPRLSSWRDLSRGHEHAGILDRDHAKPFDGDPPHPLWRL
jgi:hypothetical protein